DLAVVLPLDHYFLEEALEEGDLLLHLNQPPPEVLGGLSGAYERGLLLALDQIRARHAHDRVASSVLTVKVSPAGVSRTTPGTISPVSASTAGSPGRSPATRRLAISDQAGSSLTRTRPRGRAHARRASGSCLAHRGPLARAWRVPWGSLYDLDLPRTPASRSFSKY